MSGTYYIAETCPCKSEGISLCILAAPVEHWWYLYLIRIIPVRYDHDSCSSINAFTLAFLHMQSKAEPPLLCVPKLLRELKSGEGQTADTLFTDDCADENSGLSTP